MSLRPKDRRIYIDWSVIPEWREPPCLSDALWLHIVVGLGWIKWC